MNGMGYILFGEKYVETQGGMMRRVFKLLLNRNPQAVAEAVETLPCLSTTDYTRDLGALSTAPDAFVNSCLLDVGERTICLATSYNMEQKRKHISDLFRLCGEDESNFQVLGPEKYQPQRTDSAGRKRSVDGVSYQLFGKHYRSAQTEMLYRVFAEFLREAPQLADWAVEHLNCVSDIDYTNPANQENGVPSMFRSCRLVKAGGKTLCIGGNYALKYKQNYIEKFRRQAGFPEDAFIMFSDGEEAPLALWQKEAIRAALNAVETREENGSAGLLLQPEGPGKRRMLGELIRELLKDGKRTLLLLTHTAALAAEYEKFMQDRLGTLCLVRRADSVRELADLVNTMGVLTISTAQKMLDKFHNSFHYNAKIEPFSVSPSLVVVVEEASVNYFGRTFEDMRKRFPKAVFLGLSRECFPERRLMQMFGPILYRYTYQQAYEDGLLRAVRYQEVRFVSSALYDNQQNAKKLSLEEIAEEARQIAERMLEEDCFAQLLCADRGIQAEFCRQLLPRLGPERLRVRFGAAFGAGAKYDPLPRGVKSWDGKRFRGLVLSCAPDSGTAAFDVVFLTKRVNRRTLLNMLSSLSRDSSSRTKDGLLVDFFHGWEKIDSLIHGEFPIYYDEGSDAGLLRDMREQLTEMLSQKDYAGAIAMLEKISDRYPTAGAALKEQLAFLYPPPAENETRYWQRNQDALAWQSGLWRLLSRDSIMGRIAPEDTSDIAGEEDREDALEPTAVMTEEPSQARGSRLEQAVAELLRRLFELSDDDGLEALRVQGSGMQFGFDIAFTYRDRYDMPVNCVVECKNYIESPIPMNDIVGKLIQTNGLKREIDHWILISPNGRVTNELWKTLEEWREDSPWTTIRDIQIWTRDERVNELFGLFPDLFDQFYWEDDHNRPREWNEEKRAGILAAWRKKLLPVPHLPREWKAYLRDPRYLLTHSESDKKTAQRYEETYLRRVAMRLSDEQERLIDGTAEKEIFRWLERDDTPCALLLGDFGDGKSFFTYTLARQLAERFLASPKAGWLPLRLSLRELGDHPLDSYDFLTRRLSEFHAEISSWTLVNKEYRFLLMLDGLDEMSQGMNDAILLDNLVILERLMEPFRGNKLLVTSRKMVIYSDKVHERILDMLQQPEVWHIAPLRREDGFAFLDFFADTPERRSRLRRLQQTHDLMGLATKPLFLDMLRVQMDKADQNSIRKLDNVEIYQDYAKEILNRKYSYQLLRRGDRTSPNQVISRLLELLEQLAICLQRLGADSISLTDFREMIDQKELAQKLWDIVDESEETEEDTDNRLSNRSLLKYDSLHPENRAFCHRSMQEYFVARGICRRLCAADGTAAQELLMTCRFSHEVMGFAGMELQRLDIGRQQAVAKRLSGFAHETAGRQSDEQREAFSRLGTNSVNLLHMGKFGLPETDWSNLMLDNALLSGEELFGKDFSGSTMRFAHLDNANLTGCDLRRCDFTGVQFEKSGQLLSFAPISYEGVLLAYYRDGKMRRWQIADGGTQTLAEEEKVKNACLFLRGRGREGVLVPERLRFWRRSISAVEASGYVDLHRDVRVLDITGDSVLLSQQGILRLISLEDGALRWQREISCLFDARALSRDAILLWTKESGLKLVLIRGISDSLECTRRENAPLMCATMASAREGIVWVESAQGKLKRFRIMFGEVGEMPRIEWRAVTLTSDERISALASDNAEELFVATARGAIHHYQLNDTGELQRVHDYRLELRCTGACIDGVRPQAQYEMLRAAIGRADDRQGA